MQIQNLHVAIVHEHFALGGAEQVSYDTGLLLASMGIHTHFYCCSIKHEEWRLPHPTLTSLHLLPDTANLLSQENVDFLLRDTTAQHIQVLIFPTPHPNPYWDRLRASSLKLIYWSHMAPFWEAIFEYPEQKIWARRSFKKHLEWILFHQWKYRWRRAFGNHIEEKYRAIIRSVDRFITLCPEYSEEIATRLQLSDEDRSKLIALTNTLPILPDPQLRKEKKIVYMGRLSPVHKKVSRLIRIWALLEKELPEWTLEIYGKGSEEEELRRLISRYGLKRARLCGYCAEPERVYREAAIVALTSTAEGVPLVLLEAQNHGCVPIAFDCCAGIRFVTGKDGEFGRLVPSFDLKLYAERLKELCQDEALRARLQEACLRKRQEYEPEQNIPRWRALLEGL